MMGNEALDRTQEADQATAWQSPERETPPDRYRIKQERDGEVLTCVEAPTVTVRVKQGFCVTANAARSFPPGSIFLDGAAQGKPFIDPKRQIYNLDHHEGCVRAFTLSTCEQAMVLIRKGLDLRRRDWTVYANDADLDTVLALWVLLNHIRLNEGDGETRARIMPLLRLQGIVDAQGLELQDLCALPPDLLAETQAAIDELRAHELALKRRGRWQSSDLLRHAADRLRAIDELIYPPQHFEDVADVEELVRTEIAGDSVAIVCRSRSGIYEVERELRRLHGRRLGVVVLQRDATAYSVRQVDPYLPGSLEKVYAHLNLIDPAAGGHRSGNRWGGSADIGGSPRSSGTRVSPEQIARACEHAFSPPTLLRRVGRIASAALRSASVMAAALGIVLLLGLLDSRLGLVDGLAPSLPSEFPMLLLGFAGASFFLRGRRMPGVYGLRRLAGLDWCLVVPFATFGALAGGVWVPDVALPTTAWVEFLALLALPLASELLFRGLVQGSLVTCFPIQKCGGPWFLSRPAVLSAVLYVAWGAVLQNLPVALTQTMLGGPAALLGALVFGAAAGLARERSESVIAPILLHWMGIAAVLLARAGSM